MRLARFGWIPVVFVLGCGGSPKVVQDMRTPPVPSATASATATATPTIATAAPIPPEIVPAAPAPQADVDVTPSRALLLANKEEEIFARVRVRGLPLANSKRPTLNIALVVDASGSMDGAGIEKAREACATMVDKLELEDVLSIVTFGSQPKLIFEATRVSPETRAMAKKAIAGITANGTTDMAGGLRMGLDQVKLLLKPDGINRVVLVGDGAPNDPAAVLALAGQAKAIRVPVTSLGLGPDFDETLMTSLAQQSGGSFHFVNDASQVASVFQKEITRMERLVARNAWVEITPGPGVTLDEAIGVPASRVGRAMRISLGDITEGQLRDTVLKVRLTGHREGATVELLDAVVHYNLLTRSEELTANKFASLKASADATAVKDSGNAEVERQTLRVRVADGIVRAIAMARNGDVIGARKLLDASSKLAADGAKRFEDAELAAKVKEIATLRKTIASLAPPPETFGNFSGFSGGRPRAAAPMKMPSPADSMGVRSSHGAAMREIQGF